MSLNVGKELSDMLRMTVPELRTKYAEAFGEASTSRNKQHLIRRIIWRLQANEEGGLSERARRRAKELAADSDVRTTAPRMLEVDAPERTSTRAIHIEDRSRLPLPGTIITRKYKDRMIQVQVLPKGFEYKGEVYRSLTAIAKEVTGTQWNGFNFFRLGACGVRREGRKASPEVRESSRKEGESIHHTEQK